jgi:hypothetical protein
MSPFKQKFHVRPGHPDFLDLPWHLPVETWNISLCNRWVDLERGISRHPVVFVSYGKKIYAVKELPNVELAEHEYENLRKMDTLGMPVVEAIGYAVLHRPNTEHSVSILFTLFLEFSIPYRSLFIKHGLERYRKRLLDAMESLLVRLHLAGVFWGDCSLSNILFKRSGEELSAYVVDVETSLIYPTLSTVQREQDLMIMEENIFGDLTDLAAEYSGTTTFQPEEIVQSIKEGYLSLWNEVTKEIFISRNERYKIHERINLLNQMGFSVDEVELEDFGDQGKLKMRTLVTDQSYHRHSLHNLTGIVADDHESRLMLNEIKALKATQSQKFNRSVPLSVAAFYWMNEFFHPVLQQFKEMQGNTQEALATLYCKLLEHKWYLSEKAGKDVGIDVTIKDFKEKFPSTK